jgi:hypothetical protein
MALDTFKQQLHSLFENCDYSNMLKEYGGEEKVKFAHNCTDGAVYEIEVEPSENEFYVYQDGKQIDLFNLKLVDQDGGITKEKRQMIVKDWEENHKTASSEEPAKPVTDEPPVTPEVALAENVAVPQQQTDNINVNPDLLDRLETKLTGGTKDADSRTFIEVCLSLISSNGEEGLRSIVEDIISESKNINENKEVIEKFKDEYGEKEGKKVYYATANAQDRNPETFKKQ